MAQGRNDDLEWLYRSEPESHSSPDRPPPPPGDRRRASFGEPTPPAGTPPQERTRIAPSPAPAPAPAPRGRARGSGRGRTRGRNASPPPPPPPATSRRRRRRRPVRSFARTVVVLLLAWLVFWVGTPLYAWSTTTKVDAMPSGERPAHQPGNLWLLVGSDSREGLSEQERGRLGTGDIEGQRTDTMMLLYVPPSGRPALISIPRDSYVPIPGHGRNKINAAYAFGGAPLLIQTVEQNTGLRVDHYAEIGFGGFVNVIDALGGIEMCPAAPIKDRYSRLDIPAGCQTMDGPTALGYVRMRYADPTGDLGRMNRQREMVAGIVKKAASPMTVVNPVRWWQLNTGAAQSLHVDRDSGIGSLAGLAGPMMKLGTGQGVALTVPVANPNASTAAGSSMLWNTEAAGQMFGEIAAGDTSRLERFIRPPG
ncbi:MAG: LCP family protein [Propionibacteriaceae bacterium]|nr:LCP family protein [Propionibacteriaceae bacterium]